MNRIHSLYLLNIALLVGGVSLSAQDSSTAEPLGKYPVEQPQVDSAFIKPGLVITTQKQFTEAWRKLKGGDQPKISFDSAFVVLHVRDAADPNRHRFSARIKGGALEVLALSTRIGFQRSDRTLTTVLEFSRDGVEAVRAYNPKTRKHVTTPLQ